MKCDALTVTDPSDISETVVMQWKSVANPANVDVSVFCSQESAKVSDLNPNAKAWANHMFSLDPSGSADTTTAALQPWKEGCDSSADPGPEGQPLIF